MITTYCLLFSYRPGCDEDLLHSAFGLVQALQVLGYLYFKPFFIASFFFFFFKKIGCCYGRYNVASKHPVRSFFQLKELSPTAIKVSLLFFFFYESNAKSKQPSFSIITIPSNHASHHQFSIVSYFFFYFSLSLIRAHPLSHYPRPLSRSKFLTVSPSLPLTVVTFLYPSPTGDLSSGTKRRRRMAT